MKKTESEKSEACDISRCGLYGKSLSFAAVEITPLETGQIEEVLALAGEAGLGCWSREDYKKEVVRADGIIKAACINNELVGFIVARKTFETPGALNPVSDSDRELNPAGKTADAQGAAAANRSDAPANICGGEVELEIYNIAVKKQFRVQGIGRSLLRDVMKIARAYRRAAVWLEVRQSNRTAISFYRANRFEIVCRRKDFYRSPPEDGFVMKLEIGSRTEQLDGDE